MPSAQLLLLMEQTLHHLYHRGVIGLGHIQRAVAASLGALGRIDDDGQDTDRHVTRRGIAQTMVLACCGLTGSLRHQDGRAREMGRSYIDGTSLLNQTANLASSRRQWR